MEVSPRDRRILAVDDDVDSCEILCEALRWEGYQVRSARSGREALSMIESWAPDLVILDQEMPELNGIQVLESVRRMHSYISVIFLSGLNSTESIVKGLDHGADDYIIKPFDPLELLARVRSQLRTKDLYDQLKNANEKLRELVDIDDLTGLYNMRTIYDRIEREMDRARRFQRQICAIMMDMDHFKSVNDGHNHLFGSYVISEVGNLIRQCIRSTDIAARYGGDEFLVILTETNCEGAQLFCQRLLTRMRQKLFKQGEDEIRLTASLGFAITPAGCDFVDARGLVRVADTALYRSKNNGRNQVQFIEIENMTNSSGDTGGKNEKKTA